MFAVTWCMYPFVLWRSPPCVQVMHWRKGRSHATRTSTRPQRVTVPYFHCFLWGKTDLQMFLVHFSHRRRSNTSVCTLYLAKTLLYIIPVGISKCSCLYRVSTINGVHIRIGRFFRLLLANLTCRREVQYNVKFVWNSPRHGYETSWTSLVYLNTSLGLVTDN